MKPSLALLAAAVAACLAFALGFGLASVLAAERATLEEVRPTLGTQEPDAHALPGAPSELLRSERAEATAGDTPKEDAPRVDAPADTDPIDAELLAFARAGLLRGWRAVRADEMPTDELERQLAQFAQAVRMLPEALGREAALARNREELLTEDARRGGAFALLERLAQEPTPMTELASDAAGFEKLFARGTDESFARGERLTGELGQQLESGKTYNYPAGCHSISINFNGVEELPKDVTLAGAGMNSTLLVLTQSIFAARPLQRFSIRDCTVFTDDHYLFDQRVAPATVLLERVRVIGFDMGAGGSCALGFGGCPGLVLLARDCRFEGGYGRNPETGCLIDVRTGAFVARLERCRFERIKLELWRLQPGATMVFEQCALVDLLDTQARFAPPERRAEFEAEWRSKPGITMSSTTISFFDNAAYGLEATDWDVPQRDVNELFPGWKQQLGH